MPALPIMGCYRTSFITKIEDKNGKVIYKNTSDEKQALSPDINYVMVDMLRYAVRGAAGFKGVVSNIGGKTGTTNDYVDGWFIGMTRTSRGDMGRRR